ncbi:MAG TPA: dephospho-CoA kinase [Candidatus Izemoplasmatales bacterium]|nr:dephospho-CoA kinase [Candidatus Izemoplasmatales bacterium]
MMVVVGVTGGIASGKSLVSDWFKKLHIKVLDADRIYKKLIQSNASLYRDIIDAFSLEENPNKTIDFKVLGRIVFNDQEKLQILNAITHPYVIKEIEKHIEHYRHEDLPLLVLDVPLLFEANMAIYCDAIICVYADRETQISRLMKRGYLNREIAIQRIDSQMDLEEKKEKSDYVIDNSWSRDASYEQFRDILVKIKKKDRM